MGESDASDQRIELPSEITVELSDQFQKLGVVEPSKLATARDLALILLYGFVGSLVLCFAIGFYVLWQSNSIDEKSLSAATEFTKVIGGIFTPLLAFVLGFYFSKRED